MGALVLRELHSSDLKGLNFTSLLSLQSNVRTKMFFDGTSRDTGKGGYRTMQSSDFSKSSLKCSGDKAWIKV